MSHNLLNVTSSNAEEATGSLISEGAESSDSISEANINKEHQTDKRDFRPDPYPKEVPEVSVVEITEANKARLQGCAIVILIGPTGTGKSNFIERIASKSTSAVKITGIAEAKLDAGTNEVTAYRMDHKKLNIWTLKPVVFVDTPGFSHKSRTEMEVLNQIQKWKKKYKVKNVDRLIYLDRISDTRMPRSKSNCLQIFKDLCGKAAANRTLVITTMWDLMWNDRLKTHAAHRYDLLRTNHWQDFIAQGCKIDKFNNTFDSAWKILCRLRNPAIVEDADQKPFAFEKGDQMRHTEMGQRAFQVLQERYENLDTSLQVVQADLKYSDEVKNQELKDVLLKQHDEIAHDLKVVCDELQDYNQDYKKFRDEVYEQLGQVESGSENNILDLFMAKLRGLFATLKEGFGSEKGATQHFPPITLPDIRKVVLTEETPESSPAVRGVHIPEC